MSRHLIPLIASAVSLLTWAPPVVRAEPSCPPRRATVVVDWESPGLAVQGVVARVRFPSSLGLEKKSGSISGAVENATGVDGGLFDATVRDSNGDGVDDLVTIGLVGSDIPAGRFATVRFQCREAVPQESIELSCALEAASSKGEVPGSCRVEWDAAPSKSTNRL
jgi:hypothetical protein